MPVGDDPTHDSLLNLVRNIPADSREKVALFLAGLLRMYRDLHFCLLEINPLVVKDGLVYPLDVAARVRRRPTPRPPPTFLARCVCM